MIWWPVVSSNCRSRAFRVCTVSGDRKFAVSVTHWVGASGIGVSAPCRIAAQARTAGHKWIRRGSNLERHLWRPLASGFSREVRLWREFIAKHTCDQHHRKTIAGGIERLRRLVKSLPFDGDTILGPFELRLQVAEVRGRLELG